MKREIGIVGAGVAGLHLALYLQKHGVDATIITDREPREYRGTCGCSTPSRTTT
jgi:2-polyprenyl-6-methoxyphenol hydroxylase-like FAD-dependent oxidoreductase